MQVGSDLSGGLGREFGGWSEKGKFGTWLLNDDPAYQNDQSAEGKTGGPQSNVRVTEMPGSGIE